MKKKSMSIMSLTLAAAICLSACSSGGAGSPGAAAGNDTSAAAAGSEGADSQWDNSVAMILPGLITDEAFNQFTYEGMVKAKDELGIKTAYKENVTQDEQVEVLRQFAQQGYEIIIGQEASSAKPCRLWPKNFLTASSYSPWVRTPLTCLTCLPPPSATAMPGSSAGFWQA